MIQYGINAGDAATPRAPFGPTGSVNMTPPRASLGGQPSQTRTGVRATTGSGAPTTGQPKPPKASLGGTRGGAPTAGQTPPPARPPLPSGEGFDSLGHPAFGGEGMFGDGGKKGGGGASNPAPQNTNPLGLTTPTTNPFQQMPWFSGQSPDWWANTGHVAAANAWNGAMLPWYEWANNAANSQNTWNNNQWDQGWGAMVDQFGMGMDIANYLGNYNQGLNNLDYNTWAAGLEASNNALASQSELYGNLDRNYNEAYANMYGADMGYLGNMAGVQGNWDVAQMQALNDWYNQQARNQTDLQVATMQAFGRQQAPNARFMQNWG